MVDWFLISLVIIVCLVMLVVNIYFLILWSSPGDKNESYFPKFVVVIGFWFSEAAVLALPLDVANNEGSINCDEDGSSCGGINMKVIWAVIFLAVSLFMCFFIPISIFYHKALVDERTQRGVRGSILVAAQMEFCLLLVTYFFVLLLYFFIGTTQIPVKKIESSLYTYGLTTNITFENNYIIFPDLLTNEELATTTLLDVERSHVVMNLKYLVYLASLMNFVGWFFFMVFGGVGLSSLPFELIMAWKKRPLPMDAVEFAEKQVKIGRRTTELLEIIELFKEERVQNNVNAVNFWSKSKNETNEIITYNKIKQMVYLLEYDWEDVKLCHKDIQNFNPLKPYIYLFAGIITTILSITWFLHIQLYMIINPPVSLFLNIPFIFFDDNFPLIGTFLVGLFTTYLLACVVKGCYKCGIRFYFVGLYPMKYGETMMDAFLFNLMMLMICTTPVVQFCAEAFEEYARFSDARVINLMIEHITFFSFFWENDLFVYIWFSISMVSVLYLFYRPEDKTFHAESLKNQIVSHLRVSQVEMS